MKTLMKMNKAYVKLPFSSYLDLDYISRSDIVHMNTMRGYYAWKNQKDTDTKAKQDGIALHSLILEDIEDFVVEPQENPNRRKKEYQDWKKKQILPIIKQEEHEQWMKMKNNVRSHNELKDIFSSDKTKFEVTCLFNHRDLKCKARIDMLSRDNDLVLFDLKTCREELTDHNIERIIVRDKLYLQAAWYLLAAEKIYGKKLSSDHFKFILVEKNFGNDVRIAYIEEEFLTYAKNTIENTIDYYLKYNGTDTGYPNLPYGIDIPAYF